MPKLTLEFSLPEESEEWGITNKAADYYCLLCEIRREVRSWRKHGHGFKCVDDVIDRVWDMVAEVE